MSHRSPVPHPLSEPTTCKGVGAWVLHGWGHASSALEEFVWTFARDARAWALLVAICCAPWVAASPNAQGNVVASPGAHQRASKPAKSSHRSKGPNAPKDAKGKPLDGIPFHPYYTVHDIFAVSMFLMVFTAIIFFAPEFGGYFLEYNNFIPADPLKTPLHIAPTWYFTPYYSMLRAITGEMVYVLIACIWLAVFLALTRGKLAALFKVVALGAAAAVTAMMLNTDAKFWGVVIMGGAVVILFFLPWLDNCDVKSIRYRPDWHKYMYGVFVINFVILAYLGVQPPSQIGERVSQVGTLFYFGFFLLMPWWSQIGQSKPVPSRVVFAAH